MSEFLILAGVGFAGYTGSSWWWVLLAGMAMTIGTWWRKVQLLRQHPQVPFSSKMTTYLVASIGINLGFAAASFLIGRTLRYLFQG